MTFKWPLVLAVTLQTAAVEQTVNYSYSYSNLITFSGDSEPH